MLPAPYLRNVLRDPQREAVSGYVAMFYTPQYEGAPGYGDAYRIDAEHKIRQYTATHGTPYSLLELVLSVINESPYAVPRAMLIATNSALCWVSSENGGLVFGRFYLTHDSAMTIVVLPPKM